MILIYGIVLPILALLLLPVILLAFVVQPKFRAGFLQKIGFYKKNNLGKKTILIHAVSVGEVNAVEQLVKRMRVEFPNYYLVLSTITKTGQQVAHNKLTDHTDEIIYFPYDFFFSVNACLNAIKPDKIIIAETEIWPMFSLIAHLKKIPLMLVNGRISPKSHKGYKKISFFMEKVLGLYDEILMQAQSDMERIIDIGALAQKTEVMGNLKFDIGKNISEEAVQAIKDSLKLANNRLFIAASTHKGEDELVLKVFNAIKAEYADAKLLLAPRHPQRYEQVEELLKKESYKYSKRSVDGNFEDNDIIMLDTMGELSKLFAIAYLAFIGGSFSNTGGHNPLEANIWDVPVISGPTVFNFKDMYKLLCSSQAAQIVKNEEEFTKLAKKFYAEPEYREEISQICKTIFDNSRGALEFVINKLKKSAV